MQPAAIWTLAAAQTLAWAACYYSFPALLPHWEADLGWSRGALAAALTAALVTSALTAPLVGHLIDRGHGRAVMVGGALLGAASLALLTWVSEPWQFHACWIALGLAQAAALYEPCFSVLTRRLGLGAGKAIIAVTLVAGFASTIAFPAAHLLVAVGGWRLAITAFAAVMVVVAPLFHLAIGPDPGAPADAEHGPVRLGGTAALLRSGVFWLLAIAFLAISLNHGALVSHLLPLLADRGLGPGSAVAASACIGPMQVVGRLALLLGGARLAPAAALGLTLVATVFSGIALYAATAAAWLVAPFVILQGAGYGITSIARPRLVSAWLGTRGFGAAMGVLAVPYTAGYAFAPSLAALLELRGGYDLVIAAAVGTSLIGVVALIAAARRPRAVAAVS